MLQWAVDQLTRAGCNDGAIASETASWTNCLKALLTWVALLIRMLPSVAATMPPCRRR